MCEVLKYYFCSPLQKQAIKTWLIVEKFNSNSAMTSNILTKIFVKSIAIYPSTEEDSVRVYIGCVSELNPEEKYSVLSFFCEKNGTWQETKNESMTLEKTFEAMNAGVSLVAELSKSSISENLFEGKILFKE